MLLRRLWVRERCRGTSRLSLCLPLQGVTLCRHVSATPVSGCSDCAHPLQSVNVGAGGSGRDMRLLAKGECVGSVSSALHESLSAEAAKPVFPSSSRRYVLDDAVYKVYVTDKYGMPAALPMSAPRSFAELHAMCPTVLQEQLHKMLETRRWQEPTVVQRAVIPFALEYRDLLCIAPTATGKTFCYVFPTMLRLTLDDALGDAVLRRASVGSEASPTSLSGEEDGAGARRALRGDDVEALLEAKIRSGEVCRYCELSVAECRLCPITGTPHPPAPPPRHSDDANAGSASNELPGAPRQGTMSLREFDGHAEPRVLILVCSAQLAQQVHRDFSALRATYKISYFVRADGADEQRQQLRALGGVDVLISTPETLLPALLTQKLTLRRVKTVVLDEIDALVSLNHFEPLKMVLGALPKAHARPQRMLFGASLPTVAYDMIRDRMLLPSHRFILADWHVDALGYCATATRLPATSPAVSSSPAASRWGVTGSQPLLTASGMHTHVVFMLARVEKMDKLGSMFKTGLLTTQQRILIFCNSRHNVTYVREHLGALVPDLRCATLSSHHSQTARSNVLRMFDSGAISCLICTDLLSRGIDLRRVVYVVHYDMPTEMETWVHRCGRCGRNGQRGYVYTFFQPENAHIAKPLVAYLRQRRQLVPPKLQEYARQSFVGLATNSLFYSPTRPYRSADPVNSAPALGRVAPRFPDYKQQALQKHYRPW